MAGWKVDWSILVKHTLYHLEAQVLCPVLSRRVETLVSSSFRKALLSASQAIRKLKVQYRIKRKI